MIRMLFIVLCSIAALGCAKARVDAGGTDGATHFLLECERDADCGELSCLCGVCSKPCEGDGQCSALSGAAQCSTLSAMSCEVAELCTVECTGDDACAALGQGARCDDNRCIRPSTSDAGQGGSGGTSGSAGSAGSAGTGGTGGTGGSDAGSGACRAMDARSNGDGCFIELGYTWDGAACEQVLCGCEGSECDALYPTRAACERAYSECAPPCSRLDIELNGGACFLNAGYTWTGTECSSVACSCIGEDCDLMYGTIEDCEAAHRECAPLTACRAPTDCELVDVQCCRCDDIEFTSIASEERSSHAARVCLPGQPCPDCPSDPWARASHFTATCDPGGNDEGGTCGVLSLDGLPCTQAVGCRVRTSECCECGASVEVSNLFAMPNDFDAEGLFCQPGSGCCEAEPQYPDNVEARCQLGECVLLVDGEPVTR